MNNHKTYIIIRYILTRIHLKSNEMNSTAKKLSGVLYYYYYINRFADVATGARAIVEIVSSEVFVMHRVGLKSRKLIILCLSAVSVLFVLFNFIIWSRYDLVKDMCW